MERVSAIQGRTIICIASNWQLDPTSKHHVMRLLSRDNGVLWINYHGSRRPTASMTDLRSMSGAVLRVLRGPQQVSPNMIHATPFVLPGVENGWLGRSNQRAVITQIKRLLNGYEAFARRPIQIWTFAPDVSFLAGYFDEERLVYYCVDEYAQFEGFDRSAVTLSERLLLDRADVVIASSQALFEAKRGLHANVHLVRHGVDVEHFSKALQPRMAKPPEVDVLPGPVIGFFGLLHHWIDVKLLEQLARRMHDVQFVFIGQVFGEANRLRPLPNVHLLGRKPYADLPAYCAAFDVAILPFKQNDFTRFINPIKLREYLAAGLPVVSTPIPEAKLFAPEVTLASDVDSFVAACRDAIARSTLADRRRRSLTVADETWESVVQRLGEIVMGPGAGPKPGHNGSHRRGVRDSRATCLNLPDNPSNS